MNLKQFKSPILSRRCAPRRGEAISPQGNSSLCSERRFAFGALRLPFCIALMLLVLTCATSHYVRPDEVTEWDYTYSDTDMKILAEKMVMSLAEFQLPARPDSGKPTIAFLNIGNRTSQHIDTEGIAEKIMVALLKLGKFRIVDRELLKQQAKEIALQEMQRIDVEGAVKLGQLIGADYFLTGDVMSIEKTKGATTLAYYKLTMRLVDVRTSEIVWADEQELKKKSKKAWYE